MHLAIRAASRRPRLGIGQASTATPSSAVRHSSNVSADEFVKQSLGTQQGPQGSDHEPKEAPSVVIRKYSKTFWKVPTERSFVIKKYSKSFTKVPTETSFVIRKVAAPEERKSSGPTRRRPLEVGRGEIPTRFPITKHDDRHPLTVKSWRPPAQTWSKKPLDDSSRQCALNLRGIPLETTTKDIILSINDAVTEHKRDYRATNIADIVIRSKPDSSEELDVTINFRHPDGAQIFRRLAVQGKFKVRGVVPGLLGDDPQGEVIAQLSKQDRREYLESQQFRGIVRRTHLIYN